MRILVTGGSGYLGSALLRHIQANHTSHELFATFLSNPPPPLSPGFLRLDFRERSAVEQAVESIRPHVIINTAARMQGSVEDLLQVNAAGAGFVADAARAVNARLIHLSSDVIFDGRRGNYREVDLANPLTDYGKSKLVAERQVLRYPASVIVRSSLIYGFSPFDPRTRAVLDSTAPVLFTDERRCPIWVETLCSAILELCEGDFTGILHVAGGQTMSRYEFGVKLARALGGDAGRLKSGRSIDSGLNRPLDCTLDCTKASDLLNTKLLGVDEVLDSGI